jgi:diguanylate cyclase (GGDEF)-like protein
VLKAAARVLEGATRDADHVGRLGGDEFLVVCPDVDEGMAMELAKRISAAMARHPMVLGAHVPLRASIGVAWAARGSVTADDLVERSDHAMYASKRGGEGAPELWDGGGPSALSA